MIYIFDKATKKWFEEHPHTETTVMTCEMCGLSYKPSLGHRCKKERNNENDSITLCSERALEMIYKINYFFLGISEPVNQEETSNSKCYRDLLLKQREDLNELCSELERLITMLGI